MLSVVVVVDGVFDEHRNGMGGATTDKDVSLLWDVIAVKSLTIRETIGFRSSLCIYSDSIGAFLPL